jgi:hypothetical protein
LLAAALEPGRLCAGGGGDSSGGHSFEEESSDGGAPESGTSECQGDSDDGVVPDEIEMRVTIRNTFLDLEPVASELSLRTARRHKTAPEILLAAAFARDSPRSGNEGCAEGLEDEEGNASTRAPSSQVSRANSINSRGIGDVVPGCPIGEERKSKLDRKGVERSSGLKSKNGHRPGKTARERFKAFVAQLQDMVRQDPSFSLESFPLPQAIIDNEALKAKLVARVEEARLVVC